ncbi:glycosyltransferase family 25 protein [Cyanobium sp. HWJ4-Hawea]|uniref:glycosyltransferase family 25 protein n=1 Tax=Cyanobium sp. HWJ4-Hawea TaxID=2823713 RepID=UPI0020CEEDC7|nr:glycosyltransferase family 25 protein [Cyanobium sp. HWJ4-Hawea]MCP9810298.1 glycosyltransferase family 25 protein [Cyanobium sp. HWJ4-Hawea]
MKITAIIINLKRSKKRLEFITSQCRALRIEYAIIEAVDGTKLSLEAVSDFSNIRRKAYQKEKLKPETWLIRPGVVGCAISHINCYKKIINDGMEAALILEDDASLSQAIKAALEDSTINNMLAIKKADIIQLAAVKEENLYQPEIRLAGRIKTTTGLVLGKPSKIIPGTSCYIISKTGAEKLLHYCLPLRYASDQILANCAYYGLSYYASKRAVSIQNRHLESTITGPTENESNRTKAKHLSKKITRLRKLIKNIIPSLLQKLGLIPYYDKTFLLLSNHITPQIQNKHQHN